MTEKTKINYQKLNNELGEILVELQSVDVDIDQAIEKYQRGMTIISELEEYLKKSENLITKLKNLNSKK